ncbi:MAG: hypothetical protein CR968_00335 [Flavobacteriia bacterium]|nr:MAG: hypothetical protein CR968_00335 [Flavobacteriia bacterium]
MGLTLANCHFTEEITFKRDGSGTFNVHMDMSHMMAAMSEMEANKQDTTSQNEKVYEYRDTLIDFNEFLETYKDSMDALTPSEQSKLKSLKDIKIRMFMDEKNEVFIMDVFRDFNSIEELKDIQTQIKTARQLQSDSGGESGDDIEDHTIAYSYTKKKFARTVTMLELTEEERQQFEDEKQKAKMFNEEGLYKIKYRFPKKIKSTSLEGATISEDRHLLEYQVKMNDLIENPTLLDFEVEF